MKSCYELHDGAKYNEHANAHDHDDLWFDGKLERDGDSQLQRE